MKPQVYRTALPRSYQHKCATTGRRPITADYAVWLINMRGLRPAVVPASFDTDHLKLIPADEAQRWLKTARRRHNEKKRKAAK